jgi:hypothetical protein
MPTTLVYKGFQIRAGCVGVQGRDRFKPTLVIARHHEGLSYTNDRTFSPPYPRDSYETEDEAMATALSVGKAIIDGTLPGLGVEDL